MNPQLAAPLRDQRTGAGNRAPNPVAGAPVDWSRSLASQGDPRHDVGRPSGSCLCSVRSFREGMDVAANPAHIFNAHGVGYRFARPGPGGSGGPPPR